MNVIEEKQQATKMAYIEPRMQLLEGALQFVINMNYNTSSSTPKDREAFFEKCITECCEPSKRMKRGSDIEDNPMEIENNLLRNQ